LLFSIAFILFSVGCDSNDETVVPDPQGEYITFGIPPGFPQPVYSFQNNPLTQEGFELGRKLFYDPILSRDSTVSCGSCHQQSVAFAHADHQFSHGIDDLIGTRNSPGLYNLAWFPNFMWDGGVNHLEVQPLAPITNPVEMDETMANVLVKLRRNQTYRSLFLSAFDSDSITTQRVMYAMAQFMGAMVSASSRYDQYRQGAGSFSPSETNGLNLFRTHCESCHKEPLMTDMQFRNNGLDAQFASDPGRAMITGMPQDSGLFRVPSLRNVALTKPYMHDGRFSSLTQVLNHYSTGIVQSSTLDPHFSSGSIPLTSQDKTDIIAFLYTLTDQRFISDRRFSEVQ
ncbi:MAG: hypothetical protein RLZZ630_1481, partial [Bacteroidota bacterium]